MSISLRTQSIVRVFRSLCVVVLISTSTADSVAANQIPLKAWVHDPVISDVGVTADGSKLVALTLSDVNEAPDITVWDTTDLAKPPVRFKPDGTKAILVSWLSNDMLIVVGRQKADFAIGGKVTKWFRDKVYIVDSQGKKFREILSNKESVGTSLFDALPRVENKILVSVINFEFAEDIYEVDLETFLSRRVFRGATGESFFADYEGNIRGKSKFAGRGDDARLIYSYRHPETDKWEEHHALYAARREGMQPVAFGPDGRTVYMVDNTGRDKQVIRPYDLLTRELGAPVFDESTIEATAVLQSSQPQDFGKIIGYAGDGVGPYRQYTDEQWNLIQGKIDAALPEGRTNRLDSISDDFTIAVVRSTGPKEAGEYYLFVNGSQLVHLGRQYPYLTPDAMGEMTYVTYKARDGMDIPAYITRPNNGEPPYPTVIMPHGGPWARDTLGFDPWAQFLANRGYLVMQPQYRGSLGWGQNLWRAGDREWGGKMQDDKDDGAMWLIDQGLADKNRVAMFGYSYGGYAAMASIVRPSSPYQCAISGAGISELDSIDKVTFENAFQRDYQNPSIRGLSPLKVAEQASIPIYIFHGDRDQRVPIEQSRKYVKALERAGKDVKYQEIVDLWHSYPWFPQHKYAVFESVEKYLENDCGPGGL